MCRRHMFCPTCLLAEEDGGQRRPALHAHDDGECEQEEDKGERLVAGLEVGQLRVHRQPPHVAYGGGRQRAS